MFAKKNSSQARIIFFFSKFHGNQMCHRTRKKHKTMQSYFFCKNELVDFVYSQVKNISIKFIFFQIRQDRFWRKKHLPKEYKMWGKHPNAA